LLSGHSCAKDYLMRKKKTSLLQGDNVNFPKNYKSVFAHES
jgi:hypothetical protein